MRIESFSVDGMTAEHGSYTISVSARGRRTRKSFNIRRGAQGAALRNSVTRVLKDALRDIAPDDDMSDCVRRLIELVGEAKQ